MKVFEPFTTDECRIIMMNIKNMNTNSFLGSVFQLNSKSVLERYQRACSVLKKLGSADQFQWHLNYVEIPHPRNSKGSYKQYWTYFYPKIDLDFKDLALIGALNFCIHIYEYNDNRMNPFQVVYYSILNLDKKFNYKTKEQADKKVVKLQKIVESEYPQFLSTFKNGIEESFNQLSDFYKNDFSKVTILNLNFMNELKF